jgi:hypothetical protein
LREYFKGYGIMCFFRYGWGRGPWFENK